MTHPPVLARDPPAGLHHQAAPRHRHQHRYHFLQTTETRFLPTTITATTITIFITMMMLITLFLCQWIYPIPLALFYKLNFFLELRGFSMLDMAIFTSTPLMYR